MMFWLFFFSFPSLVGGGLGADLCLWCSEILWLCASLWALFYLLCRAHWGSTQFGNIDFSVLGDFLEFLSSNQPPPSLTCPVFLFFPSWTLFVFGMYGLMGPLLFLSFLFLIFFVSLFSGRCLELHLQTLLISFMFLLSYF